MSADPQKTDNDLDLHADGTQQESQSSTPNQQQQEDGQTSQPQQEQSSNDVESNDNTQAVAKEEQEQKPEEKPQQQEEEPTVVVEQPNQEQKKKSPPPPRSQPKVDEPKPTTTPATTTTDIENQQQSTEQQKSTINNDDELLLLHANKTTLYPKGPDGKFDYSKSPAQLAFPDKEFDSNVTICYRDVSVKVRVSQNDSAPTIVSPVVDGVKGIISCGKSCERKDFYRIKDVSGVIRPGTMSLILSPPGEGKSTYLRALANRIELSSGKVVYNGRDFDQAKAQGVDLPKMTQYVDQVDCHAALLTVHETISFAHALTSVKYDEQRVEDAITLLGLEECRNTILGNALIRGVSGGQRKRVTTGELLVSDASVLFLDEYSNGLDSSTSVDIAKGLKKFCLKYNSSIVATLQQPTPELFELFDRIVVLREGQVVFDGPIPDVLPYFAAMGFHCPDDVDTADFLIDCLSQPRSVILRQKEEELHAQQKKHGKNSKKPPTSTASNKPKMLDTTYGQIQVSPSPCITIEEMIEYYKTTPQWKEIEEELDKSLPVDEQGNIHEITDFSNYNELVPTEASKDMYKLGYRLPIIPLLSHVISRQGKIFIRNTQTMIPRFVLAIIMSLIYGSLYWNIRPDEYILRLAAFTIGVSQVAFGNFVEIPLAAQISLVVKKQLSAKFYPAWAYTIATWLTAVPMCIAESAIYCIFLYFMCNAYRAPAEFFAHYAILLVTSLMLSTWFRFLACLGGDEQSAQSMAGPSTGVMMVFAGLFVTRSNVPNFMIWLYWISPFSWATRALSLIEFLSPRYDQIVVTANGTNARIGDLYIATVDMQNGSEWIGYAVLYLLCLSFFVVFLNSWFLVSRYYEESIGTRRSNEQELVEADDVNLLQDVDNDDELMKEQVQAAALQQVQIQNEQSRTGGGSTTTGGASSTGAGHQSSTGAQSSAFNSNALKTLREHLPFAPAWLSFSDVSYTVKVKKDKETVDRILLNNVNGYAQPGKMLALMGASGAGKTTLLDVIAGLKNTGVVEGKILINGQPATKELLSSITGYVEQFDTLYPYSTVHETLLFAARLRLPRAIPDNIKLKIVDEIIDILDLSSIQHFIIGNAKIQGLSPAQAKRVNIGVELVANPSILFLDEPTTGLDSKNAMTVMKVVKRIARSGRAIICTIHQPSAELFFLFDRLLLLGAGGYQIYFGDLGHRAQGFVQYLSRCPGITPIKPRVNPASWMLVELGVGVAAEKGDTTSRFENIQANSNQVVIEDDPEWAELTPAQRTVQKFKKMFLMSEQYKFAMKRISVLESIELIDVNDTEGMERHHKEVELAQIKRKTNVIDENDKNETNTSKTTLPKTTMLIPSKDRELWFVQLRLLFVRNFQAYWRDLNFIYSRYLVQLFLSFLFGFIYFNLKVDDVASAISGIGSIYMTLDFNGMLFMTTSMPVFFDSRPTFYREKASGYYKPWLWSLCQLLIELVWIIPGLICTIIPSYFLINLYQGPGWVSIFFTYIFSTIFLFLVYISVSMAVSALTPSALSAGAIAGAFLSFQGAMSGVTITWPNVPAGYRWLYRMLPSSHILQSLIMPQFDNNNTVMTVAEGGKEVEVTVRDYISQYLGWGYGSTFQQLGWATIFIAVVQIIAWVATAKLAFNKR